MYVAKAFTRSSSFFSLKQSFLIIAFIAAVIPGAEPATADGLVSILMPDCAEPYTTNLLEVQIALDPGDSLKVYDIRIRFDTLQVVPDLTQIQSGNWFSAAGPTFFWFDMIDDLLIVNQAVLGPGLAVIGTGIAFSIPVESLTPGNLELGFDYIDLYNTQTEIIPSVGVPHQFSAPCIDFQLQISYNCALNRIELEWLSQTWTQYYEILAADDPYDPLWLVIDTTYDIDWWETRTGAQRNYRVRAVLIE